MKIFESLFENILLNDLNRIKEGLESFVVTVNECCPSKAFLFCCRCLRKISRYLRRWSRRGRSLGRGRLRSPHQTSQPAEHSGFVFGLQRPGQAAHPPVRAYSPRLTSEQQTEATEFSLIPSEHCFLQEISSHSCQSLQGRTTVLQVRLYLLGTQCSSQVTIAVLSIITPIYFFFWCQSLKT